MTERERLRRRLACLQRRKAFLDERVVSRKADGIDISYDAAEASALAWVIPLAEAEIERLTQTRTGVISGGVGCVCEKCQRASTSAQQ